MYLFADLYKKEGREDNWRQTYYNNLQRFLHAPNVTLRF